MSGGWNTIESDAVSMSANGLELLVLRMLFRVFLRTWSTIWGLRMCSLRSLLR